MAAAILDPRYGIATKAEPILTVFLRGAANIVRGIKIVQAITIYSKF